jgi:hypothetical protein
MEADQAEHVDHCLGREPSSQCAQVASDPALRDPTFGDRLEKLLIGGETHAQPAMGRLLAHFEDHGEDHR